jgi:hypothetical protein
MTANLEKYKEDLSKLVKLGEAMNTSLTLVSLEKTGQLEKDKELKELKKKTEGSFEKNYQKWYTQSCAVIRQLIPDRMTEFENLYKGEGKRKEINSITYTIQDWLTGVRSSTQYTGEKYFDDFAIISMRFNTQLEILKSVQSRFSSSLFEIRQLLQADLFDSELDTARELSKKGFLRGAGVISGVVLEKHLSQVCANHKITIRKKNPTISEFNDLLKKNDTIDVPSWRFIQRLGDLRNLCGHNKDRDPTEDEVSELIEGVDKVIKTIY